ncbi:MAG: diguanylate cyclase, partial [Chloroflexota bacterium]
MHARRLGSIQLPEPLATLARPLQFRSRRVDRRFAADERRRSAAAARPTLIVFVAATVLSLIAAIAQGKAPAFTIPVTLMQLGFGIAGLLVLHWVPKRSRVHVAFVALLLAVQGPVVTIATTPELGASTLTYLALIPLGIAIFIPWSTRAHGLWLLGFVVAIVELVVLLAADAGSFLVASDVVGPLLVAASLSLAGNVAVRARRRQEFDLLQESLRLRRQIGRENRAIQTVATNSSRDARTDALTGVANRMSLSEDLAAARLQEFMPGSVLMIDLDHFKALNDTLGHAAGDAALATVAAGIGAQLRATDHLYRFGGEEFVVRISGGGARATAAAA